MRKHWLFTALAAAAMFFGALAAAAQTSAQSGSDTSSASHWYSPARYKKYNPANLFHKDSRNASEQLAANPDEDKKLTDLLQGLLAPRADVKEVCSEFKTVEDCVAAIHASHNVGVHFACLKWTMTDVKPAGAKSCSEPEIDRPLTLERAIHELKPDADARSEAKTAHRKARENISDARS